MNVYPRFRSNLKIRSFALFTRSCRRSSLWRSAASERLRSVISSASDMAPTILPPGSRSIELFHSHVMTLPLFVRLSLMPWLGSSPLSREAAKCSTVARAYGTTMSSRKLRPKTSSRVQPNILAACLFQSRMRHSRSHSTNARGAVSYTLRYRSSLARSALPAASTSAVRSITRRSSSRFSRRTSVSACLRSVISRTTPVSPTTASPSRSTLPNSSASTTQPPLHISRKQVGNSSPVSSVRRKSASVRSRSSGWMTPMNDRPTRSSGA